MTVSPGHVTQNRTRNCGPSEFHDAVRGHSPLSVAQRGDKVALSCEPRASFSRCVRLGVSIPFPGSGAASGWNPGSARGRKVCGAKWCPSSLLTLSPRGPASRPRSRENPADPPPDGAAREAEPGLWSRLLEAQAGHQGDPPRAAPRRLPVPGRPPGGRVRETKKFCP